MREATSHIAAERAKLDELEKETVGKLKEEEDLYEKEVMLEIIDGIRNAGDILLKEYLGRL